MDQAQIIKRIRTDLKNSVDEKSKQSYQRFFKEKVKFYGVKSSGVGIISKKYWKEVENLPKQEIFKICEELLLSDYCEEAFIVSGWIPKLTSGFEKTDFKVFEKWVDKYINNWAKCDGFCNHTIGNFIELYPEYISELKRWSKSKNIWMKRASAVSLIIPARKGKYLSDVFEISETLLLDPHDMVQKGYGWLLKEASRKHEKEVFNFVIKHKSEMPRTALRYAIELMPKNLKKTAMVK